MRINHNSLALNASNHYSSINDSISKSMARLSSGYKITSPSDDAAGLAISTKMDAQIRGLDRASLNSNDGVSVIESAEGGMNELHSILSRMRELAVQASNDVESEDDRDAIQEEIDSLKEEIDQITDSTAFNGQKLLNGDMTRRSMSSAQGVNATYISEDVPEGNYQIDITAAAKKAEMSIGLAYSGATVTEEQAGTVTINGFSVEIEEGMSMTEVFEQLQTHLTKIGIDVAADDGSGNGTGSFENGDPVMLRSKEYGSKQEINVDIDNPELAALLGMTDGASEQGEDCTASITSTDDGFKSSASFTVDGYDISIVDRNGFELDIEVDDAIMEKEGSISTNLEVFSAGTMVVQTGSNSGEQLSIDIADLSSDSLGVDNLIMYTHDYATQAITAIDEAISKVSSARSKLGAYQNRLEDNYDNLEVESESMTEAYSRIMDTDMAEEMTNYTQLDVLSQAAISMMQKSNERPESILQLLQ